MSQYKWILRNVRTDEVFQLVHDVKGWEALGIKLFRSEVYDGIFQEPSQKQLKFIKNGGGYEFVESIFKAEDINANIEINCMHRGETAAYNVLFKAKLNLGSYNNDGAIISVNIEQSHLYSQLLTRNETNVDLASNVSIGGAAITAPTPKTITLPGQKILFENEWVIEDGYRYSYIKAIGGGDYYETWVTPSMGLVKGDIDSVQPSIECNDDSSFAFFEGLQYIQPILTVRETGVNYPITVNFDLHFKGIFTDDETTGGGIRENESVQLKLIYGRIDPNNTNSIDDAVAVNIGGYSDDNHVFNFEINATGSFQLNQGDSVWLVWQYYNTSSGTYTTAYEWQYAHSYLKLTSLTDYTATDAKVVMVHEVFNQVVDSIADSDGNFYSELYGRTDSEKITYPTNGEESFLSSTNGLLIRLFDKPQYANLKQLFASVDALHNVGLGIVNGKIRVEKKKFFYDSTTRILTLPRVASITTTVDESRYFNKAEIGYNKWETEFKGGLDETCTKHEYSTLVATIKGLYTKLSDYISSSYAIELTRRKNKNVLPNEDYRYDNDNFWLALNSDYSVQQYADAFSNGADMQALTTAYNMRLTPKRMLLAHISNITACLQTIQGYIAFTKGTGNTTLSVAKNDVGAQEDYTGEILAESAGIAWNDANVKNIRPIWLPLVDETECPLTGEQFAAIQASPYGFIEYYTEPTDIRRGFILECDHKMKGGMTHFKLLRRYD